MLVSHGTSERRGWTHARKDNDQESHNGSQDDGPEDDRPEDGRSQDDGPEDDRSEDGRPQDDGPEDDGSEDDGPEDDGPEDDGSEEHGPEDGLACAHQHEPIARHGQPQPDGLPHNARAVALSSNSWKISRI